EPEWKRAVTETFLAKLEAECRDVTRAMDVKSYLCVPMKLGAKSIGAILLFSGESGRRYDTSDLNVAIALAERAAIAVENACLFEELRAPPPAAASPPVAPDPPNRPND